MKNFIVLYKHISTPNNWSKDKFNVETVQVDYLLQQASKEQSGLLQGYVIDEKSLRFEIIGGHTCIVLIAYKS